MAYMKQGEGKMIASDESQARRAGRQVMEAGGPEEPEAREAIRALWESVKGDQARAWSAMMWLMEEMIQRGAPSAELNGEKFLLTEQKMRVRDAALGNGKPAPWWKPGERSRQKAEKERLVEALTMSWKSHGSMLEARSRAQQSEELSGMEGQEKAEASPKARRPKP